MFFFGGGWTRNLAAKAAADFVGAKLYQNPILCIFAIIIFG